MKTGSLEEFEAMADGLPYRKDYVKDLESKVEKYEYWLMQYREELKSTNVFHQNQGIINALNKLLNHDQH